MIKINKPKKHHLLGDVLSGFFIEKLQSFLIADIQTMASFGKWVALSQKFGISFPAFCCFSEIYLKQKIMMNNNADNPYGTDVDFVERFTDLFLRQRQCLIRRELVDSGLVTHMGRKKRYYLISEKLMNVLSPYDVDIRENVEWQKQIREELESRIETNPSVLRLAGSGS